MIARGLSPSRLAVTTARSQLAGSRLKVVSFHIGHDRRRTAQCDDFGGRAEGEGRADHGIARPDVPGHEHEVKRVGTARAGHRVPRAAECRKLSLQSPYFRPLDKLAMREHAGNRGVDRGAEPTALRGNVDEWDRPLVKPGVLIYGSSWRDRGTADVGSAGDAAWAFALRHA